MFQSEKLPFLLTLLIGMLGWTVKHTVDRTLTKPLIEYSVSERLTDTGNTYEYIFTNLSLDKHFDSIGVTIVLNPGDTFTGFAAYSLFGEKYSERGNGEMHPTNAEFDLYSFHPGFSARAICKTVGLSRPSLKFYSKDTFHLKKKGVETWLVRNELYILLALTLFWLVIIIVYFFFLRRQQVRV